MEDMVLEAKGILQKTGIPVTMQRVTILKYLICCNQHPTVDEIFSGIKEEFPVLSKATVYNTLQTFVNSGIANELRIDREKSRYDLVNTPHHHFLCTECGGIYDVKPEALAEISIKMLEGHDVEHFFGYFYGVCKNCKQGVDTNERIT